MVVTKMISRQFGFSNIHTGSTTSPHCQKVALLNTNTKTVYDQFISITKEDINSVKHFKACATNFSVSLPITKWATLSEHLLNSEEDDKRFVLYLFVT